MRTGTTILHALMPLSLVVMLACSTTPITPSQTATVAGPTLTSATTVTSLEIEFPAAPRSGATVQHHLADVSPEAIWEPANGLVLYSVTGGESVPLEDGRVGAFSPESSALAWSDGSSLHIRDLDMRVEEEFLVGGTLNGYVSEHDILLTLVDSNRVILHLFDGTTFPTSINPSVLIPIARAGSTQLFVDTPVTSPGPKTFTVTRPSEPPLTFSGAFAAALADERQLVLAVPATDQTELVNLVLVDMAATSTELLISVDVGEHLSELQVQLPLGAANGRVAWTERYCGQDPQVHFMDLDQRIVHSTDLRGWVSVTPDHRLALGDGFSTTRLVDPDTETSVIEVRPPGGSRIHWDATYRWALAEPDQGHGTACPGS